MARPLKQLGSVRLPWTPKRGADVLPWAKRVTLALSDIRQLIVRQTDTKPSPDRQPFHVRVYYDGSAYKYEVAPGWVIHQNIGLASQFLTKFMPTLGSTALTASPAPSGSAASAGIVYVNVVTTERGVIEDAPTIGINASLPGSTHHIPPDPGNASGTTGNYYFQIAEISLSGGIPYVVSRSVGNIHVPNQLIQNENVGGYAELYQDYDDTDDIHYWRTVKGGDGITVTQNADDIEIAFDGGASVTNLHPWKVTAIDGTANVTVAAGAVGWFESQGTGTDTTHEPWVHQYHKQASTASVAVTAAGYIVFTYTKATADTVGAQLSSSSGLNADTLTEAHGAYASGGTVKFSTDPTAETADIVLVLAEVSLNAGDSQVDAQILTHNPIIDRNRTIGT